MGKKQLNQIEIMDIFQEMGNIGMGSSAAVLGEVLDATIENSSPRIFVPDSKHLIRLLGKANEIAVGVLVPFQRDVMGMILFVFKKEFVEYFLRHVTGEDIQWKEVEETHIVVLQEIASIMASAYLNAIASYASIQLEIGLPAISMDMIGSIMNDSASQILNYGEQTLCIENSFFMKEEQSENHILLMLREASIPVFLQSLEGVK